MSLIKKSWNKILDTSIYFSFDRSGYLRHSQSFDSLPSYSHQHHVITGCNTGIGYACAQQLISLGADVSMICRESDKSRQAHQTLSTFITHPHQKVDLFYADLTKNKDLLTVAQQLNTLDRPIHGLIHNAGVLPRNLVVTDEGIELTRSIHVLAVMRLTSSLMRLLKLGSQQWLPHTPVNQAPYSRIVLVSSGGMYTQRLEDHHLRHIPNATKYDGTVNYAKSKRAQVELAKILHQHMPEGIDVQSMHPGWVDTTGVQNALPVFWKWTKNRLRTPDQGADTLTWLMSLPPQAQSYFWFDRQVKNQYLLGHRCSDQERLSFLDELLQYTEIDISTWK